jgi:hypothetical protein
VRENLNLVACRFVEVLHPSGATCFRRRAPIFIVIGFYHLGLEGSLQRLGRGRILVFIKFNTFRLRRDRVQKLLVGGFFRRPFRRLLQRRIVFGDIFRGFEFMGKSFPFLALLSVRRLWNLLAKSTARRRWELVCDLGMRFNVINDFLAVASECVLSSSASTAWPLQLRRLYVLHPPLLFPLRRLLRLNLPPSPSLDGACGPLETSLPL